MLTQQPVTTSRDRREAITQGKPWTVFRAQTGLIWEGTVLSLPEKGQVRRCHALTKESWPLASLKCGTRGDKLRTSPRALGSA